MKCPECGVDYTEDLQRNVVRFVPSNGRKICEYCFEESFERPQRIKVMRRQQDERNSREA